MGQGLSKSQQSDNLSFEKENKEEEEKDFSYIYSDQASTPKLIIMIRKYT